MFNRRLFITGLGFQVVNDDLRNYFSKFGFMTECSLQVEKETGISRGFAFITYSDDTSVENCLRQTSHNIKGRNITVSSLDRPVTSTPANIRSKKLFVSYIGVNNVTEDTIRQAFAEYGIIKSIEMMKDSDGSSLFYCIICFDSEWSVDMCLTKQHCLLGRSVMVRRAVRKEDCKKAQQSERERVDREEKSKHGYAGYSGGYRRDDSEQFPSTISLLGSTSQYYTSQLADPYTEKCYSGAQQPSCLYETAYTQAIFHNAYNYKGGISSPTEGSEPLSASDYFNKLISIWREQCHSINRRLSGSMLIEKGNNEYDKIWMQISTDITAQQDNLSVVFWPLRMDVNLEVKNPHVQFPYMITCCEVSNNSLRLSLSVPACRSDSEYHWLLVSAYPGLLKWFRNIDPLRISKLTNRLLNIEKYALRYRRIKELFGKPIIEKWTERTDPQKFVYEECGIASYLLELWDRHGRMPHKFADVGCGNGLLVHLLNKEGVCLCSIFSLMMKCDFFVLPCCPYNFHGKFTPRKNDYGSQYDSFLQFIREICLSLGFLVEEDRLSIPSTKRLCFACSIPQCGLVSNVEEVISNWIGADCRPFIARPKKEPIKNCLNIPIDVRVNLTLRLFKFILEYSDERKEFVSAFF
uniref:tRNA (uracil-O(2)-)-methyltransferase n=1 Tax=Heterorhabditis bacteriophora TaxID=37862 RepID=A0A1I7X312_HETBA